MPTVDSGIAYYCGTLLSQVCHLSRPGPQLAAAVSAVPLVIACKMAELLMNSANLQGGNSVRITAVT